MLINDLPSEKPGLSVPPFARRSCIRLDRVWLSIYLIIKGKLSKTGNSLSKGNNLKIWSNVNDEIGAEECHHVASSG